MASEQVLNHPKTTTTNARLAAPSATIESMTADLRLLLLRMEKLETHLRNGARSSNNVIQQT